jgi:hypothetical protein
MSATSAIVNRIDLIMSFIIDSGIDE